MNKVIDKIYLEAIRDELMTIAPDPEPDEALQFAFDWWKDRMVHKHHKNHQLFYDIRKRGWMRRSDAEAFCRFLNSEHSWRCLA